jgi:hypothetical protein
MTCAERFAYIEKTRRALGRGGDDTATSAEMHWQMYPHGGWRGAANCIGQPPGPATP